MDISRKRISLYLAVRGSVRGGRVMTLPRNGTINLFGRRAYSAPSPAASRRSFCPTRGGGRSTASPRASCASSTTPRPSSPRLKTKGSTACRWTLAFGALYTGEAKRHGRLQNILIRERPAEKADRY